jgi:hypothetical protein
VSFDLQETGAVPRSNGDLALSSRATATAEMGPIPAGYFLFLTFTFSESEMAGLQAALSVTWARYSKVFAFSVSEKLP